MIRRLHPEFSFRDSFMKLLFGSDEILADDFDPQSYLASQEELIAAYARAVQPYRLYE